MQTENITNVEQLVLNDILIPGKMEEFTEQMLREELKRYERQQMEYQVKIIMKLNDNNPQLKMINWDKLF